jgi:ribosomal protein S18 acetylase RimI-like enzyme
VLPHAIVPARETSLIAVNRLIARSKSYWTWPEGYLEKALPLHEITTAYLRDNLCLEVVTHAGELLAFASVVETDARVVLDNLWVAPEHIRQGIGRIVCHHVFRLGKERGWSRLWVIPDPPAEGFYRALGFSDTGERVPSRVSGGPLFSVYCRPL